MKIALVTETFPPEINGVAMTYGQVALQLARLGHSVTVYHPGRLEKPLQSESGALRQALLPGVPIPRYPQLRMGLPCARRLCLIWQKTGPDLVHVATEGPLGASAVKAARRLGIPVTSSFHTNFHEYAGHYGFGMLRWAVMAWLRRFHNRTARTFVPTGELRDQLEREGFRNLTLLSRGVDISRFDPVHRCGELRRSWGAEPQDCVVLHVGRLAPEKNYLLLGGIYGRMREANPSCRFVFVGEGPLQAVLARRHPDCIFAGPIPHERIPRWYASADVYVHASQSETFGNVVLEGLASGLAFAGFDYAAAAQFVRHKENGLLSPYGRNDKLSEAAVELAANPELRTRLGRAARESVLSQSWEAVAGRFASDLEAVTREGGARLAP